MTTEAKAQALCLSCYSTGRCANYSSRTTGKSCNGYFLYAQMLSYNMQGSLMEPEFTITTASTRYTQN